MKVTTSLLTFVLLNLALHSKATATGNRLIRSASPTSTPTNNGYSTKGNGSTSKVLPASTTSSSANEAIAANKSSDPKKQTTYDIPSPSTSSTKKRFLENVIAEPPLPGDISLNMTIYPTYLADLDVRLGTCKLQFYVVKEWQDRRLSWDQNRYGMSGGVRLLADQLWIPDLEPYSGIGISKSKTKSRVLVFPNGRVRMVQSYSLTTAAQWKKGYSKPSCEIRFGSWTSERLKLMTPMKNVVGMTRFITSNRWELEKSVVKISYPSNYLEVRAAVFFFLRSENAS